MKNGSCHCIAIHIIGYGWKNILENNSWKQVFSSNKLIQWIIFQMLKKWFVQKINHAVPQICFHDFFSLFILCNMEMSARKFSAFRKQLNIFLMTNFYLCFISERILSICLFLLLPFSVKIRPRKLGLYVVRENTFQTSEKSVSHT